MRKYLRDRYLFVCLIITLLAVAPLDFIYYKNAFRFWPYFNWEIGFGNIPFNQEQQVIFIESIDGVPLNQPMRMGDFFMAKNLQWNPTKDYLIQVELMHSLNTPRFEKVKKILVERYFKQFAKGQIQYRLSKVYLDPLEYYKHKKIIEEKVLVEVESEW